MSWVAALPEDRREAWLARVAELVDAGEMPAELPVHVVMGFTARDDQVRFQPK